MVPNLQPGPVFPLPPTCHQRTPAHWENTASRPPGCAMASEVIHLLLAHWLPDEHVHSCALINHHRNRIDGENLKCSFHIGQSPSPGNFPPPNSREKIWMRKTLEVRSYRWRRMRPIARGGQPTNRGHTAQRQMGVWSLSKQSQKVTQLS